MPASHFTSARSPSRRSGRRLDGRSPVAKPSAVMAKCCGNAFFIAARNERTSATVNAFGSSSVYVKVDVKRPTSAVLFGARRGEGLG
jgi:hypothetical protein